jgi:transcriptional regulator with XRE-family HTH domain
MSRTETAPRQAETATTAAVTVGKPSVTQTIADVVEEAGALRSRVSVLRDEVEDLHDNASQVQVDAFMVQVEDAATREARQSVDSLLNEFAEMGFSWRDVAQLIGVSVPAIQKWRRGGGVTPNHRRHIARALATCKLLEGHPFSIQDIASWLEMPIEPGVPITPLDLLGRGRIDLLLRWAGHSDARPEGVLDEIEPDWRDRYESRFEVFTAPDGQPGIRFRQE